MGGRGGAWQSRKHSFCCCVPLRRCLASSKTLFFSLSLSLRVAFSCHLSPPLSLIPFFRLLFVHALPGAFLLFLVLACSSLLISPFQLLLVFSTKPGKGTFSPFTYSEKGICVSWLACLVSCFPLFSPSTVFRFVLPGCPLSLAAVCAVSSRLRQAEQ